MDCIFCKIIKKEIPSNMVYEDQDVVAFKDIHPSAPVHYLIVPTEHIPSVANLKGNHKEIISTLIFRAKQLAEDVGLKGYKLVFNVGREGGQLVDHLHLHLLGGWTDAHDADAMPK